MNNKKLLIILAGLIVLWLGVRFLSGPKDRSFDPILAQVDSTKITSILIYPVEGDKAEIKLQRSGGQWTASHQAITTVIMESSVRGMLDYLSHLEANRIVAKTEQKWIDYEVDEDKGTRVKALDGEKILLDLMVGRFSFDQMSRSATSYVRLVGKPEVYAVDGFVSMTFNRNFDSFRDKSILRLDQEHVVNVEFTTGMDRHTLQKNGQNWLFDGQKILDSATVANYISGIGYLTGSEFFDGYQPSAQPDFKLRISADQQLQPVELSCYVQKDSTNFFVLHSSSNQGNYFKGDSSQFFQPVLASWLDWIK